MAHVVVPVSVNGKEEKREKELMDDLQGILDDYRNKLASRNAGVMAKTVGDERDRGGNDKC